MRNAEYIDEQTLGTFVDGQLDEANRGLVLEAMENDPAVRERVYRLRRAKDLMKLGFGDARAPTQTLPRPKAVRWRLGSLGLAASILILVGGFIGGYLGYSGDRQLDHIVQAGVPVVRPQTDRVLLHISESDPAQFAAVIDYTRKFLEKHKRSGGRVAVVANAGGLDLMRAGVSPFEKQIVAMMRDYDNVHFIACAASILELRKKGVDPLIIEKIDATLPAIDQIVSHVQQGWTYVKVKSLTNV
jgi:intracellular sulfur oxidation DsrE/DsrF family protein